jgi:hypothetical protein
VLFLKAQRISFDFLGVSSAFEASHNEARAASYHDGQHTACQTSGDGIRKAACQRLYELGGESMLQCGRESNFSDGKTDSMRNKTNPEVVSVRSLILGSFRSGVVAVAHEEDACCSVCLHWPIPMLA